MAFSIYDIKRYVADPEPLLYAEQRGTITAGFYIPDTHGNFTFFEPMRVVDILRKLSYYVAEDGVKVDAWVSILDGYEGHRSVGRITCTRSSDRLSTWTNFEFVPSSEWQHLLDAERDKP